MESSAEQRRASRQQKAAARNRRRLRRILAVVVAAVVLCLAVFLIIKLQKAEKPAVDPALDTRPKQQIHLAFAGDLNLTRGVIASGENGSYQNVFMDIVPLLANADLTVLNFEGSAGTAPRGLLTALRSAGVDFMQLANSYAISEGVLGLSDAIDAVYSAGMEPLGVYKNRAAYQEGKGYTIREVDGVRIAFVAFTKGLDGMTLPAGSSDCVNILYTDYDSAYQNVNTTRIRTVLDAAAQEEPDLTVVLLHWGSEYNDTISASQEKIRKLLFDRGVDAIIGTHPHYVQEMALSDNGQFIAYSLGDLYGDAERSGSEYSVILDLEVTKTEDDTRITGYTYTPIYTVTEKTGPVKVLRIREAMHAFEEGYVDRISQEDYDAMVYALTRIEARINPPKKEE